VVGKEELAAFKYYQELLHILYTALIFPHNDGDLKLLGIVHCSNLQSTTFEFKERD